MLKKMIVLVALVALVAGTQVFAADDAATTTKQTPAPAPARERANTPGQGGAGAGGGMRGMGGMGMMGMGVWNIIPGLSLTEDQKTKFNELQTSAREKMMTTGQAVMAAQMKVMEAVNAGAAEADVKTAAADYIKAWTDQQVQNAALVKQARAILTAEQNTELDKQLKERAAQFGNRGQAGQGGRNRSTGGAGGADGAATPRRAAPAGGAQN
jgi:Spy/CpxP family protein refolding chaperone